MSDAQQTYIVMLVLGVLLLGAEVFLPGGILGLIGAMCLVGAAVAGFHAFSPPWSLVSVFVIVFAAGLGLALWIRFFPRTGLGKKLSLSKSGSDFKSYSDETRALIGQQGIALSTLRPSGIARIADRRVDVMADGDWIDEGTPVAVVAVEGVRILVQATGTSTPTEGNPS